METSLMERGGEGTSVRKDLHINKPQDLDNVRVQGTAVEAGLPFRVIPSKSNSCKGWLVHLLLTMARKDKRVIDVLL